MATKTRILFLIPSLVAHGAERQLCELVRNLDASRFDLHVVVFYGAGAHEGEDLAGELEGLPQVTLHDLRKRRGLLGLVLALPRFVALVARVDPHLVHGYMDGNLPALVAGLLLRKRVVWGIRRTSRDLGGLGRVAHWSMRVNAGLSRFVDLIIFNSQAGRLNHRRLGLRARRDAVIPNGFDVARFRPDPEAGAAQRRAWGLPLDAPLVGIVGRMSPVKDHPTFLRAAARVAVTLPAARFVCVGGGTTEQVAALKIQVEGLGLSDRVHWAGAVQDMGSVYNALSVLVLCSLDEGLPNVLGEAMACGIPCATTRVGDAAALVGGTGVVVDSSDDAALAVAIMGLLSESEAARVARSAAARERICGSFSVATLAHRTEGVLMELLTDAARTSPAPEEA
jgi:glycosyltransferase involved in cell wall biosynthesis